jgi:organic radical activating enzyme
MWITELKNRHELSRNKEFEIFSEELDWHRSHNQYPVTLFGRPLVNIYRNINVQVLVTRACNFICGFCIENDGVLPRLKEHDPSDTLDALLQQYSDQGITPCVSITGGEPTLFPARLRRILEVCRRHSISRTVVNTNGTNLKSVEDIPGFSINLSRHHHEPEKIKEIFGKPAPDVLLPERTVAQCVLLKNFIDSLPAMKAYMDSFIDKGFVGFSFRGLTQLDPEKQYISQESYSQKHFVDIFEIMNQAAQDPDFTFVKQVLADHYIYEILKYRGRVVRLTYSNFDWLRKVETEERSRGEWFSRVSIVHPDGKVYAGWTYDINLLKGPDSSQKLAGREGLEPSMTEVG